MQSGCAAGADAVREPPEALRQDEHRGRLEERDVLLREVRGEERHQPVLQLAQRAEVQPVVPVLALVANGHERGVAQDFEMLRDGRLTEAEPLHEFTDARLTAVGRARALDVPLQENLQEIAPGRVGHDVEDVRHGARVGGGMGLPQGLCG